MINAIILDDEIKGSSLLQHKLNEFSALVTVMKIYNDPTQALDEIQSLKPDVLFLDVEMPVMNGFQFLEQLGQFDFEVIFVTAYNVYTLDALRANALDFLLKPVDPDELATALTKLAKIIAAKREAIEMVIPTAQPTNSRIALPTVEGIYFVKREEIIRVEAMSNYSVFNLVNMSRIIVSKTLKEYETMLESQNFLRINRSVIVNLDYVVKYKKGDGGCVELVGGSEFEVSPSRKYALIQRLFGS